MSFNLNGLSVDKIDALNNKASVKAGNSVINISAISDKAFEVWADFDGNNERNKSYSIEEMPKNCPEVSVKDCGGYYLVAVSDAAVRVYKENLRLEFVTADDSKVVCEVYELGRDDDGSVYMSSAIKDGEHFYGLGEDNDTYVGGLDRLGQTREMITGQKINIGHVTADIPVTFFMSTGAGLPYGMFTDNSYPMFYDIGKSNASELKQTAKGGDLIFYFFGGADFTEILNEYTNLTGKPPMPPLWVLGYTQCRCSYWCWEQVDELVATIRSKNIPLDCIVFDYDWAEYFNNYQWHPRWEGLSPEKIAEYRKQGLHFMASNSGPMLKKNSDTYESAIEAGILARDTEGKTITCGHYGGDLMDFSNPDLKDWLRPQLERILDDGVEAWWLDLTEPEGDPQNTVYYDGERNKVHNPFSLLSTKTYTEISREHCPERRSFVLTRTGTAGIQRYNTAIWSGDVFSDYKTFSAHIPEMLNTTVSGIPLWTSDAGGFISSTTNSTDNRNFYSNDLSRHGNLYERWVQFAAFSPMMRIHHAGESAPYAFGELVADGVAHYARLRYRLLPYIYSYSYKSTVTGEPLVRPLVFEYPDDENVYDIEDEYLFGSEMLVAPVHEEEATERMVYFPKGTKWYDMDYGFEYEGGNSYKIYAPQNRIPVFVRSGAIVPMSKQIYNTKDLDRSDICLDIYPEGESSFEIYSDDGSSMDYTNGSYTLTAVTCCEDFAKNTKISVASSNDKFAPKKFTITVHANAVPTKVTVNGAEPERKYFGVKFVGGDNCWYYDDVTKLLTIRFTTDSLNSEIDVEYDANALVVKPVRDEKSEAISGQLPFILPAASIPCRLEFENFDRGGEGVAYHKINQENENGLYRKDGVEIEMCNDVGCGHNVTNLVADEWLEYTINVLKAGNYSFRLRMRAEEAAEIDIAFENVSVGASIPEAIWQDIVTDEIALEQGEQTFRITVKKGSISGNYFEIIG